MEPAQLSDEIKAPSPRCKNCNEKLSKRGKFCPSCGQRDFDGRIRMRDMLGKFISSLTHLDNKFVKMAWQLLIPGKVSVEYFQGKIKRYPHPLQFFFIVMFFFLLFLSRHFTDASINIFEGSFQIGGNLTYSVDDVTVTRSNLQDALQRCVIAREYRTAVDSMPQEFKTEASLRMQDSIHQLISRPWERATSMLLLSMNDIDSLSNPLDSISIHVGINKLTFSTIDFATLEPDSIIKKYRLTNWLDQITTKQGVKAVRDQHGFVNRYVGSLGWTILSSIMLMAFVLLLIYRKSKPYYVEHFIFLVHQQAGIYLLLTLAMIINSFLFPLQWLWLVVLAWFLLNLIPAIRRFYGDPWGWAVFKGLFLSGLHAVMLIFLFLATLLVVFAAF